MTENANIDKDELERFNKYLNELDKSQTNYSTNFKTLIIAFWENLKFNIENIPLPIILPKEETEECIFVWKENNKTIQIYIKKEDIEVFYRNTETKDLLTITYNLSKLTDNLLFDIIKHYMEN